MDHEHTENRIATQRIDERVFLRGSPADSIQVIVQERSAWQNAARSAELSEISYTRP
jgi:hypothetical protein